MLREAARAYAGRTPLDDPDLSPINASLNGLPPVHLSVGLRDLFLADVRVARLQLEENRSEEHTSELQSRGHLVCRLLLEKKNNRKTIDNDNNSTTERRQQNW